MKEKEKFHLVHVLKRRIYYFYIRFIRLLPRFFSARKNHKFLFILSPPYCGSTMLNQLLSSSKNVSSNNNLGTREGQLLPGVKHFMFQKDRWDESVKYSWEEIKKVWMRYWDFSKPIFLDKSIPNIMRVDDIEKVFSPIKYICIVRNPYAQVEGIMRRNRQDAKSSAEFVIKCLDYQNRNKDRKNSLFFSYEELCDNKNEIRQKVINFIPELYDINTDLEFSSHNYMTSGKMRITNLNDEKILKISDEDLDVINSVFTSRKELLEQFNYKIIKR